VKTTPLLAIFAFIAVLSLAAFLSWKHFRPIALPTSKVKLTPAAPPRLTEVCPEAKHLEDLFFTPSRLPTKKAGRSTVPLSQDETTIYKAVIGKWTSHAKARLNLSVTTYPLNQSLAEISVSNCGCVQDIYVEESSAAFRSFHRLSQVVLTGNEVTLVDPRAQGAIVRANDPHSTVIKGKSVKEAVATAMDAGLFSLSEIAFDRDHRYAIVSYSFWCGLLCGSGATLVFEKIGPDWKATERECGGWVS